MKTYKEGQAVWWIGEKEKVRITHINRLEDGRVALWIYSLNSGTWVLYKNAVKPIISLPALLHS